MAMAGALRGHPAARRWWALAAIAGALLLGGATSSFAPSWLVATACLGALVTMHLLAGFEGRHAVRGLVPGLFAISALGVYSTVPDTEEALVLAAVAASGGLLANLGLPLRFGAAGSGALAVVYWWTVAAGGVGRDGSVVGAAACLGVFLAEPVACWLAGRLTRPDGAWRPSRLLWFAVQALGAVLCGRVAGLEPELLRAAQVALPAVGGLAALLWLEMRSSRWSG
jgi:hypothetical protein